MLSSLVLSAVGSALPVVADTQVPSDDPQNGPTRPWANTAPSSYSMPQQYYSAPYSNAYAPPYPYAPQSGNFSTGNMPQLYQPQPRPGIISSRLPVPTLPEGLLLSVQLQTSIDTERAEPGDYVQTNLSQNVSAGGAGYLQGGSVISGTIAKAPEEKHSSFGHAGKLTIDFEQVRLPNGTLVPLKGHLVGRISNYIYRDTYPKSNGIVTNLWRDGLGSGLSSGMGSVFGAVADRGYGPGNGAYFGAGLGGASSILSSIFYRHHNDIFLHPGTKLELQLDAPLVLPGAIGSNNGRYLPGTGRNTGIF